MTTLIEYPLYQKITKSGSGSHFQCLAIVGGVAGMMFGSDDPETARHKAEEWVNKNFDTPERRERMAALAERRVAAKKQKQKESAR